MQIPDIFQFNNSQSFFYEFIQTNKANSRSFSFQKFAQKIDWPKSLLHELSTGKTKLSIRRAVEFSLYFKLEALTSERLIFFSLLDSNEPVRNFAQQQLSLDYKSVAKEKDPVLHDLSLNHSVLMVYSYFKLFRKFVSYQHIVRVLPTCKNLNIEKVKQCVKVLEQKELIKIKRDKSVAVSRKFIFGDDFDTSGSNVHIDFSNSFINYCLDPIPGPASYHSFVIQIPSKNFEAIRKRFMSFRNWLWKQGEIEISDAPSTYLTIQADLNLFPVIKKTE